MMYEKEFDCADGIVINVFAVDRISEQRAADRVTPANMDRPVNSSR